MSLDWLHRTPLIRFLPKHGAGRSLMRLEPQPALSMPTSGPAAAHAVVADPARRARHGLWLGLLGMLIFAGTIPMTRLASGSSEAPQLPAVFVAIGRAGVAGLLSAAYLLITRAPWPRRQHWPMLALSVLGNVIGWPLLLGLAVRHVDAMHASVISGLMPLTTAALGALLLRQRPSRGFWAFALLGAALVVAFAAWRGAGRPQMADLLLLGAVIASAIGYVAGVRVTAGPNGMTPEQTISWVLVLAFRRVTLPVLFAQWPAAPVRASRLGRLRLRRDLLDVDGLLRLVPRPRLGRHAARQPGAAAAALRVHPAQRAAARREARTGHARLLRRRDGLRLPGPAHVDRRGGSPAPPRDPRDVRAADVARPDRAAGARWRIPRARVLHLS